MSQRPPGSPRRVGMRRGPQAHDQKTARSNLVTAWTELADAAAQYSGDCVAFSKAMDRTLFRIQDTDDIFEGLPLRSFESKAVCSATWTAGLPLNRIESKAAALYPNTIWGIVCESHPEVGGAMINAFFTDRLGRDYTLLERHKDAILFSMEEHSSNPAFFEIVFRCRSLRKEFGEKPDFLVLINMALTGLHNMLLEIPKDKLDSDRYYVGKTSGVYGTRESDAFFCRGDLFRCILEVLLSTECKSWRTGDGCGEELQDTCLLVCQIGDLLKAHPQVLTVALAFLSNAMAPAFRSGISEKLVTFIHTFAISSWSEYLDLIINCCAANRMDDEKDLREVRFKIFEGRPIKSRTSQKDTRMMLCHAVAMPFQLLLLLHTSPPVSVVDSVPAKFVQKCFRELRERLLPVFRENMDAPLAGRWPGVRTAFSMLVSAGDKSPMPLEVVHLLRDELINWQNFIVEKFLAAGGISKDVTTWKGLNVGGFLEMNYSFGSELLAANRTTQKGSTSFPQIHVGSSSGKTSLPPMSDSVLGGSRIGPYSNNLQLRSELQKRIDAAKMEKPTMGKEWIPFEDGRVVDALEGTSKTQVLGTTLWQGLPPQNSFSKPSTKFGFFHKPAEQTYIN